jgi:hypothetical protein
MTSPENQKGQKQNTGPQEATEKMALSYPVHVRRAQTLGSLSAFELNGLALVQGFIAVLLNGGKMNKDILSAGSLNEPVTFGSIEPLHYPLLLHAPSPSYFWLAQRGRSGRLPICERMGFAVSLSGPEMPRATRALVDLALWQLEFTPEPGLCFPDTKTSNAVGLPCTYRRLPPARRAPFMAGN